VLKDSKMRRHNKDIRLLSGSTDIVLVEYRMPAYGCGCGFARRARRVKINEIK
jgi:hypothetical protein